MKKPAKGTWPALLIFRSVLPGAAGIIHAFAEDVLELELAGGDFALEVSDPPGVRASGIGQYLGEGEPDGDLFVNGEIGDLARGEVN